MIQTLIELTENEVPITLSSLIKTVYDESSNALSFIEDGNVRYYGMTTKGYAYCLLSFDLGEVSYRLTLMKYNENKVGKMVKVDDQVIIARILKGYTPIAINTKYID